MTRRTSGSKKTCKAVYQNATVAIVDRTPSDSERRIGHRYMDNGSADSSSFRSDEVMTSLYDTSTDDSSALSTESNLGVVMNESDDEELSVASSSVSAGETYDGQATVPKYETTEVTTAKDGELALLNDSIIVRYSLKVQMCKEYAFKPAKVPTRKIPIDNFQRWFTRMQQLDPTFALLPWSSDGCYYRHQYLPLVDSKGLLADDGHPDFLHRYFRRFRRRSELQNRDYLHVDVRVAHTIETKHLLSLAGPWLKARKMGMWPKKLQAEDVVCIGCFLFSTREMDLDRFEKELSDAGLGFKVALRYRTMSPRHWDRSLVGGVWNGPLSSWEDNTPKSVHVDVRKSVAVIATRLLSEIYCGNRGFPIDAPDRHGFPYIETLLFVKPNHYGVSSLQREYLTSLRTHRIQGIDGRHLYEPSSPWLFEGSSIREWLLQMRAVTSSSSHLHKLFVSVDLAFRSNDELIITYHKSHENEARTIIQTVEPFIRHVLSHESSSSCDSTSMRKIPLVDEEIPELVSDLARIVTNSQKSKNAVEVMSDCLLVLDLLRSRFRDITGPIRVIAKTLSKRRKSLINELSGPRAEMDVRIQNHGDAASSRTRRNERSATSTGQSDAIQTSSTSARGDDEAESSSVGTTTSATDTEQDAPIQTSGGSVRGGDEVAPCAATSLTTSTEKRALFKTSGGSVRGGDGVAASGATYPTASTEKIGSIQTSSTPAGGDDEVESSAVGRTCPTRHTEQSAAIQTSSFSNQHTTVSMTSTSQVAETEQLRQQIISIIDLIAEFVSDKSDFYESVPDVVDVIMNVLNFCLVKLQRYVASKERIKRERDSRSQLEELMRTQGDPITDEMVQKKNLLDEKEKDVGQLIENEVASTGAFLSLFQLITRVLKKLETLRELVSTGAKTVEVAFRATLDLLEVCQSWSDLCLHMQ